MGRWPENQRDPVVVGRFVELVVVAGGLVWLDAIVFAGAVENGGDRGGHDNCDDHPGYGVVTVMISILGLESR
jgi:hypothetical protein